MCYATTSKTYNSYIIIDTSDGKYGFLSEVVRGEGGNSGGRWFASEGSDKYLVNYTI